MAEPNSERIDIRTCVYSAIAAVSGVAASADVSAEIDMPETPVMCDVDSRRVERILRNLLANAYDHCEGKPVILTVRAGDDTVGISVRDHGVGLKPGEAKEAFDRFWRCRPLPRPPVWWHRPGLGNCHPGRRTTRRPAGSLGMPGEGTCFRLTLATRGGTCGHKFTRPSAVPCGRRRRSDGTHGHRGDPPERVPRVEAY
ncbi:MAG: HAMP domain-containing sensor histidine kinase [Lawsonella clevelandensis]